MIKQQSENPIYRVEFTWGGDYGDKVLGIRYTKVNVNASNKFSAAAMAWDLVQNLTTEEPDKMNVTKVKEC